MLIGLGGVAHIEREGLIGRQPATRGPRPKASQDILQLGTVTPLTWCLHWWFTRID